jgi:hypothetical protein
MLLLTTVGYPQITQIHRLKMKPQEGTKSTKPANRRFSQLLLLIDYIERKASTPVE